MSPPFNGYFPTIKQSYNFDPKRDAEILQRAIRKWGLDEMAIIELISNRSNKERQIIVEQYKSLFGMHPYDEFKGEANGKFENLLKAVLMPFEEFYASEIHKALSFGGAMKPLIEILCSLTNTEILYIKAAYEKLFRRSMENDLASNSGGSFRRMLVSLSTGRRDENIYPDLRAAEQDAIALLRAGELIPGTDEPVFNAILCSKSIAHLLEIFKEYHRITGNTIETAIRNEYSDITREGFLAIVKCAMNKPGFFAEQLREAIVEGNDGAINRIMVTRSEADLEQIKTQFSYKFGRSLESMIQDNTVGHHRALLTAFLK